MRNRKRGEARGVVRQGQHRRAINESGRAWEAPADGSTGGGLAVIGSRRWEKISSSAPPRQLSLGESDVEERARNGW